MKIRKNRITQLLYNFGDTRPFRTPVKDLVVVNAKCLLQ